MYKICVTEQSARRQRELEAGLLSAMCSQQYEDITVSDLCDHLQIPRKSFYRYFASKDGALYALIDHTLAEFTGEFFTGELPATIDTLERFFTFWKNHAPLLDALARSNLSGILVHRSIARVTEEDLLARSLLPHDSKASEDYAVTFLISGLVSLVIQWHHAGFREHPRQLASIAAHLMTRSLFPPTASQH